MSEIFTASLNKDLDKKSTSARWNDGDERWETDVVIVGGTIATTSAGVGTISDAAVTNPASDATAISALKGLLTRLSDAATGIFKAEDTAASDAALGIPPLAVRRDTAASGVSADGDWANIGVDADGRLYVLAKRDPTDDLSTVNSAGLVAGLVVKASPGRLYHLLGYTTTAQFIQVFDAVSDPGDTTVPVISLPVAANSPFSIPIPGHACATGIYVSNSATGDELTEGAADMFLTAYYL